MSYNAATKVLTWSGTDTVQSLTFSETQSGVNLTSVTGGTSAYVGFSGGDGKFGSTQTITNFNFAATLPNASNVLPSTTPLFVAAGGTLDLYGVNQTVGDLSGAGAVTNTYNQSIATLTTGGDGTTQTFSGTLQDGGGSLALHVVSPGGLVLTGQNAYSGATTINTGGTLQLGNGQSGNDGSINGAGGGVVNNGMLAYNLFGAQTAGYKITGSGAVTQDRRRHADAGQQRQYLPRRNERPARAADCRARRQRPAERPAVRRGILWVRQPRPGRQQSNHHNAGRQRRHWQRG